MSHQTVILSSFEEYLGSDTCSPEERQEEERGRKERLARFPHAVMLQVSFPELDFANRLCWQQFGPADGECSQRHSEYRMCDRTEPHSHAGKWMFHWFAKTDYNFGFNEWYFSERADQKYFLSKVSEIHWGEKYPK